MNNFTRQFLPSLVWKIEVVADGVNGGVLMLEGMALLDFMSCEKVLLFMDVRKNSLVLTASLSTGIRCGKSRKTSFIFILS